MLAETSNKISQLYGQLLLTQAKYQASAAAAQEIHLEVLIC